MWYPLAAMKGVLEALHQGDYDTAIDLLTRKALFGREWEAKEASRLLAAWAARDGQWPAAWRYLEEHIRVARLEAPL